MFGLGFSELIVILFIALIFIGPKKLPEIAKSLGKSIRDFQDSFKDMGDQIREDFDKIDNLEKIDNKNRNQNQDHHHVLSEIVDSDRDTDDHISQNDENKSEIESAEATKHKI